MSRILLLVALLGVGQALPIRGPEHETRWSRTTDRGAAPGTVTVDSIVPLIRAARLVENAGLRMTDVWPGFWSEEKSYLIARGSDVLLVAEEDPPLADWRAIQPNRLPSTLEGRAFLHSGPLPDLAGGFDMDFQVGELSVAAVRWSGDTFTTLERLFHECFHVFQARRFQATRGAGDLGVQEERFLPSEALSRPEFRAMAEVERRILRRALARSTTGPPADLLRSYLAVRTTRLTAAPEAVRRAEINVERKEGSAEYVGLAAAALATGDSSPVVRERLDAHLTMTLDTTGFGDTAYGRFRGRLYGTGASLAYLLERLAPGWRAALVDGAPLSDLVADAVAFDPVRAADLAETALEAHGYSELLTRERERSAAAGTAHPVRDALASGRVTLVLELVPRNPRALSGLETAATGGLPRQVEEGLWLYPGPDIFELSLADVQMTVRGRPVIQDMRLQPDTIRVTVPLPTLPVAAGTVPPEGSRQWPGGLTLTTDSVALRIAREATTRVERDTVLVRVEP